LICLVNGDYLPIIFAIVDRGLNIVSKPLIWHNSFFANLKWNCSLENFRLGKITSAHANLLFFASPGVPKSEYSCPLARIAFTLRV